MTVTLYVGERNYSSWSLRPWLALMWGEIEFEERFISLDQSGYGEGKIAAIKAVSPSGRVPALDAHGVAIWDSLAISEWAAENAPRVKLWPTDASTRAIARSVTCEVHSGFPALRRDLPMNIRRRCAAQPWPRDTTIDLERVGAVWNEYRHAHAGAGPYLFGTRSIADAFFTPIATRLRSYSVSLGAIADEYRDMLLADPAFKHWEARALEEWKAPFSRADIDGLYP